MSLEVIIAIAVIGMLVIVIGLKVWLGKLLKAKMDEGSVIDALEQHSGEALSSEVIAGLTSLTSDQVERICKKHVRITRHPDNGGWALKP